MEPTVTYESVLRFYNDYVLPIIKYLIDTTKSVKIGKYTINIEKEKDC